MNNDRLKLVSMTLNVGIVGAGLVGSAFIKQLNAVADKFGISVVLIARSSKTIVSKDYSALSLDNVDFSSATENGWSPAQIAEFLANSPKPAVLVDNTSNEALAQSYPEFLAKNISVVTPNKKAFSSSLDLWSKLFDSSNKALVYHEATVGAGLPVISTLNDLVATGDKIHKIEGILSGTLSYIFNEFGSSDVAFSQVVSKAKELGYTEPDPREDLNGLDVARKVTILSRLAGNLVDGPTSFPVESLIPKPLEGVASVDEFMAKLPDFDGEMAKLRDSAKAEGKVLRFVGKVDLTGTPAVKVGVEKYDASHPFAALKGSDNVISFTTDRYTSPLIVQGAGAGDAVTAMGVLADLIKVAQRGGHK